MTSVQSAMNYLRRRFSDTSFNSNLPNGYMVDAEADVNGTPTSLPAQQGAPTRQVSAPAPQRTNLVKTHQRTESNTHSGGFFASLASGNPLAALKQDASDRSRTILIIDDQHTEWSKYFKGKKIHGDHTIHVEQAEFKEITLSSHSKSGVTVDINSSKNGNKIIRSFKPDFVLVRQPVRSMVGGEDFKNLLIGLKYGGVPAINSLHSQYNYMDKTWVFSQLIRIQKKLGQEKFPLIEQTFYPSYAQMVTSSHFPIVLKIGHAHRGMAKFKVNNHYEFQDVVGVAALTNTYVVLETYIDAKYDIRVQKIGGNYKAYVRTSVSKNWKANVGSAMLEETVVTDRYKLWVDACSEMFGGLDMVAVKAVHGNDGKDYILGVTDCSMPLIGERQEEDRRIIVDLVLQRMTASIRPRVETREQLTARHSQSQLQLNKNSAQQEHCENTERMSAPPSSRVASAPPSVIGSEPASPASHRRDRLEKRSAGSEDEESKAERIRTLRQSFATFINDLST